MHSFRAFLKRSCSKELVKIWEKCFAVREKFQICKPFFEVFCNSFFQRHLTQGKILVQANTEFTITLSVVYWAWFVCLMVFSTMKIIAAEARFTKLKNAVNRNIIEKCNIIWKLWLQSSGFNDMLMYSLLFLNYVELET